MIRVLPLKKEAPAHLWSGGGGYLYAGGVYVADYAHVNSSCSRKWTYSVAQRRSEAMLVGWAVEFISWLVQLGGLVGWLVGWWVGCLVAWLVGGLVGWLVGWLNSLVEFVGFN